MELENCRKSNRYIALRHQADMCEQIECHVASVSDVQLPTSMTYIPHTVPWEQRVTDKYCVSEDI